MIVFYALWSIIAWVLSFAAMLLVVLVCLPLTLIVPFERIQGGWPAALVGFVPRLTLSRFTVRHDPQHDAKRVSVYVMNHTSMMDGHVAVGSLPHPFCGIQNAAHLKIPGYGWLMRMANAIPVYKKATRRTEMLIEAARERASRGISILSFPEAHRTLDGTVRPFRTGVFRMAREAGLPVVPVALRGMFHVLPKGRWYLRPGHLDVYIGPQYETAGLSDDDLAQLAQTCHGVITNYIEDQRTVSPAPTTVNAPSLGT